MPMLINPVRFLLVAALSCMTALPVHAEDHRILMLNTSPDDAQHTNVFAPDIIHVEISDTITFIPTDAGHNTASKRGMIPEGAEAWNSPMDEEFSVTLTVPGIYGYVCLPHYEMGMVGLIVVGATPANLNAVRKVRHPGAARAAFRDLLESIETAAQD